MKTKTNTTNTMKTERKDGNTMKTRKVYCKAGEAIAAARRYWTNTAAPAVRIRYPLTGAKLTRTDSGKTVYTFPGLSIVEAAPAVQVTTAPAAVSYRPRNTGLAIAAAADKLTAAREALEAKKAAARKAAAAQTAARSKFVTAPAKADRRREVMDFVALKRNYENALRMMEAAPADLEAADRYGEALEALSAAVARSVIKKVLDPRRKAAVTADSVTDSGQNPAIKALSKSITTDLHMLDRIREANKTASKLERDKSGNWQSVTVDKSAVEAIKNSIAPLGDGMDLVQEAAAAILEAAAARTDKSGEWLDRAFTVETVTKRVYTDRPDLVQTKERETSAIRESFRAVRSTVDGSRAIRLNLSKYTYLEDLAPTESGNMETIYRRFPALIDLGFEIGSEREEAAAGAPASIHSSLSGLYTVTAAAAADYDKFAAALNLTMREKSVLSDRLKGLSVREIGIKLYFPENWTGTGEEREAKTAKAAENVRRVMVSIQEKAAAAGIIPADYTPKKAAAAAAEKSAPKTITAKTPAGAIVWTGTGIKTAAAELGIDPKNIRKALNGKRPAAGGYIWIYTAPAQTAAGDIPAAPAVRYTFIDKIIKAFFNLD